MRVSLLIAALGALWLAPGVACARAVTDSGGRVVNLPAKVHRVFAAGAPASILLYMLAPEKMTGWPRAPRSEEKPYIAKPYRDLPALGRLTGRGGTANLEVVLKTKPDLILDFGSVRDTYISLADNVQAQTGIPYILINGRFEKTSEALRLLGRVLGVEARAEMLATYVEDSFSKIDRVLKDVPLAARPRVYLARQSDGLETGLKGSINTEIIERAGGRNVADGGARRGMVRVSIEQVIAANPDTIITWDRRFYDMVWNDPLWANIEAVKQKRVFLSPTAPFGWIDRPPSLNRIIGLKWLAKVFYPEKFPEDLRITTRNFYELFYHVKLSEAEIDRLMAWSEGQAPEWSDHGAPRKP